jgi:serine/threonine protein kinase
VLDLAFQVGSALARAHQMGVIHRDLKPENMLLVPPRARCRHVKLLDFGIAKIMDAPSLTGSQQIFGTPGYIAPEYIKGNELDGRPTSTRSASSCTRWPRSRCRSTTSTRATCWSST